MNRAGARSCDVLIIGSGAAGLLLALRCASGGNAVLLATKGTVEESNTAWAQGGVAAALDLEDDSAAEHLSDTLAAGAGLSAQRAAAIVAAEAPQRVDELHRLGVAFDLDVRGRLELMREAAHSRARVAHAADATGRAITSTLIARVTRHPNVSVLQRASAAALVVRDGRCEGAWLAADGALRRVMAGRAVALATGGVGRVFMRTTNPAGATGDGLQLALAAGAQLADLEFVQFHPTALALEGAPALLISEAARGDGATLIDSRGRRFCFAEDARGELAPRDIVARAIWHQLQREPSDNVFLDLRPIGRPPAVRARFPNIAAACARFGLDIGTTPVPVSPAAHYLMGGVVADLWGRSTLASLYAVGECACSGLHGANRLASNSLAECLVFASRAAEDIEGMHRISPAPPPDRPDDRVQAIEQVAELARLMWNAAGIERNGPTLKQALAQLESIPRLTQPLSRESIERRALVCAAALIARAALLREESRGSHYRTDFPERDDVHWRKRILWTASGYTLEPVAVPA